LNVLYKKPQSASEETVGDGADSDSESEDKVQGFLMKKLSWS
jgi:hypothetical protein